VNGLERRVGKLRHATHDTQDGHHTLEWGHAACCLLHTTAHTLHTAAHTLHAHHAGRVPVDRIKTKQYG
jgi:hypothetical protein